MDLSGFLPEREGIPRVEAAGLTAERFESEYDTPAQPVVLRGLADGWRGELRAHGLAGWRAGRRAGCMCCLSISAVLFFARLKRPARSAWTWLSSPSTVWACG